MRYKALLLLAFIAAAPWAGAQDRATATRAMDPFRAINVASEIEAELILSKEESVQLDLKGAETGQMITEVEDGVLKIRMKTGSYKEASLKVQIHFRDLNAIEATGRASVWSYEDLFTDNMVIELFNGGAVRLGLYCDTLSVNISQGSILTLKGEAAMANLKVNTNATFNGYEFKCEDVEVSATSTGKAKISVSNSLKAVASTGGFVGYAGNPRKVDRKVSLKGEILETVLEE